MTVTAMRDLGDQGKKPTLALLHAALDHRGSMSTLVRLKAEIEAAAQPVSDSPEALKAFREIWGLAVEEGRTQQEAVAADLRENLKTLAAENERLDGTALAAQNRATELELAVSRAEAELNRIRTEREQALGRSQAALVQASAHAAEALQKRHWLRERDGQPDEAVFINARGQPLTRDGVQYIPAQHVKLARVACPSLKTNRASPHVLRHTTAMDLSQDGVDRSVIALWLGHESMDTTQIYLHANLELKEQALAKTEPFQGQVARYRPPDQILACLQGF
jgi:hypothetical protein